MGFVIPGESLFLAIHLFLSRRGLAMVFRTSFDPLRSTVDALFALFVHVKTSTEAFQR